MTREQLEHAIRAAPGLAGPRQTALTDTVRRMAR